MWRGLLISFLDDIHLSDFREMRLKSKGDFDIAYSEVMGIEEIYSFQARALAVPILKQWLSSKDPPKENNQVSWK